MIKYTIDQCQVVYIHRETETKTETGVSIVTENVNLTSPGQD